MYPLLWITFLHNQHLQVATKRRKKNPWQYIEPHGIVLYYVSIITQLLDEKICFLHSSVPVYTTDCIPYTKCTKLSTHILLDRMWCLLYTRHIYLYICNANDCCCIQLEVDWIDQTGQHIHKLIWRKKCVSQFLFACTFIQSKYFRMVNIMHISHINNIIFEAGKKTALQCKVHIIFILLP